jgi:hypothetical protein
VGCSGLIDACMEVAEYSDLGVGKGTFDTQCDGEADVCMSFDYATSRLLTRVEYDRDCDGGEPDWCTDRLYDEKGRLTRFSIDLFCDGTLDECYDYEYESDDRGRDIKKTRRRCRGQEVECCFLRYE